MPRFNRVLQEWGSPLTYGQREYFQRHHEIETPVWLPRACPVLFLRTNGVFAVWDPARNHQLGSTNALRTSAVLYVRPFVFDEEAAWNGLVQDGKPACNGLIQDWVNWQLEAQGEEGHPFHSLSRILSELSHPDEPMKPGKPVRLYVDDPRKIPTIDLPYETIPVVHASAGMKRILGLAYLVTWMWTEHVRACTMIGWKPADRVVVLFEEPETHLHPKWQRHITPALLGVLEGLGAGMRPPVLMTTHAPMVLASLEPHIDGARDKLFLLELNAREVSLREVPWVKRGDAVSWLTSPIFGLEQARSPEAEKAIGAAYDFMAGRLAALPEGLRTSDEIDRELRRLLPDQDKFWPRWVVYRERKSA